MQTSAKRHLVMKYFVFLEIKWYDSAKYIYDGWYVRTSLVIDSLSKFANYLSPLSYHDGIQNKHTWLAWLLMRFWANEALLGGGIGGCCYGRVQGTESW